MSDGYWKDGDVAHGCGAFIDEHDFIDGHHECPRPEQRDDMTTTITQPGLHEGISNKDYHRGLLSNPKPLSASMAKSLVTKSPAEFMWERDHPVEKDAFDEGQAVHELVLEGGFKTIDVYDFDSWRTKKSQEAKVESYLNHRHPMLKKEVAPLEAMAKSVQDSKLASSVFTQGRPEVSALVVDPKTGTALQARFDWLRLPSLGRPIIGELKTTAKGANPRAFNKEIADRHYHLAGAFYSRVLRLLGYDDPGFIFVVVSKTAPYLVSVIELSAKDRAIGDLLVDKAIATYTACLATNAWPGFDTEIHQSSLPVWASYEAEEIAA